MDKYSGKKLDSRYEIHELIGVGGMAMVYRAYDTIDDRVVAIKILKDEFSASEEFVRRFKNESKAIAVLSHPNIVKVYDVSFGDMIQYIVMEYIDGITLKEYIDNQQQINWKEAVHFTVQILQALQHAHEKGIVHRDIKPQNIMLLQDGTIKVTDFGIARFSNMETRTMTDKAIGSVHYIAPEQARGDLTDGKSDIYSVGVMLYEMITGKLPFEADNAVSVAIMQLQSNPRPPQEINPSIPDGLEEITIKAMQKDPRQRYQTAGEMLKDIELFRQNPSIRFEYTYLTNEEPAKIADAIHDVRAVDRKKYDDSFENIQEEAEKRKSPTTNMVIGVVLSFALVAIVCVVVALFNACEGDASAAVPIPNFVGQNIDDVRNNPEYKFTWEIQNSFDPDQAVGTILKQDPEPSNKMIREGSVITLTVNSTNTLVSVPYVNGEPEDSARQKIEQKNLETEIIYVLDDSTAEGMVRDTSPKAGSEVEVDSVVKIFVSRTKNTEATKIPVPNVLGKTLDEAKYTLETENGFVVDYEYNDEVDKPQDTVIAQSPLYDTRLEAGSTVKLIVARGISRESTVQIYVDLPEDVEDTVFLRVTVDGVVNETYSKYVVPKYNSTYTIEVTGTGNTNVVVDLDGNVYREYVVNFDTQEVTTTRYDYVYPTTEPPTEAPTEAPTEPETWWSPEEPTDPYEYY